VAIVSAGDCKNCSSA